MPQTVSKTELRETWEAAAPGWAKWENIFSAGLVDATKALLDMAAMAPGMRVLDVACGAGDQTIQAAMRVGPTGSVVASDISATMLRHVGENAAKAGVQNVDTLERAADELDSSLAPFDAAISRLGLMLFPSPTAALAAVQKVLRPGARFAALVFTTPAKNPFFAQSMAILLRHAGKSPPPPGGPGLFALGADGALEAVIEESGLSDVKARTLGVSLRLPSIPDTLEMMQQAFGAYRAVVADLDEQGIRTAWAEVGGYLERFEVGGHFETDFEVLVGSGAKPA